MNNILNLIWLKFRTSILYLVVESTIYLQPPRLSAHAYSRNAKKCAHYEEPNKHFLARNVQCKELYILSTLMRFLVILSTFVTCSHISPGHRSIWFNFTLLIIFAIKDSYFLFKKKFYSFRDGNTHGGLLLCSFLIFEKCEGFFEPRKWEGCSQEKKLNETWRLLVAISLKSFKLVCERNIYNYIVKTSDGLLNVITIFVVSCCCFP